MKMVRLGVQVQVTDADPQWVEDRVLSLRGDLLATEVDAVDRVTDGPAPAGTRGLDATTIGTLLVAVTSSTWALTQVINTIRDWVGRGSGDCAVKITVEGCTLTLTNAPTEQQRKLVEQFINAALVSDPDLR